MAALEAKGGKKANREKFYKQAISISQDKNEDGSLAAVTAIIVGGGPAGMIAALALLHKGFRVIVCEEQEAFTPASPPQGQAEGPTEPLLFSPETVYLMQEWGLSAPDPVYENKTLPDLGPKAAKIPYRDLRSLGGRLLRREPSDCYAVRAQDMCHHIHEVLTKRSAEYLKRRRAGNNNPVFKASYELRVGVRVLDVVDISWGIAAYLSNGEQVAGDFLLGADGVRSMVREYISKFNPNARDHVKVSGYTQWQGGMVDDGGVYKWFGDALHLLVGSQCSCLAYRLPSNVVNWTILRPTAMEGVNQLSEWKTMMLSWPIGEDGSVTIPAEETMALRSAFDLFDADKSGSLDYEEVKKAMEVCGISLTYEDIQQP
jgi:hypothetical protein